MITRLEIDGFKSFRDFKLDFAPFQVIIGPNGAGKSNLFDALRLLSKLAEQDLRSAFQDLRGEAGELFSVSTEGRSANRMRFAIEMMVDNTIRDSWGAEVDLKHTRLRYDLEVERRIDSQELERLYVTFEELQPITRKDDDWIKRYGVSHKNWLPKLSGGRGTPFISTQEEAGKNTLYLHQDGRSGRKASVAEDVERTVLNSVINTEFPHAFAAREEMRRWRLLQFNPEVLRQPSPLLADQYIAPDGKNLPNALARLKAEDQHLLTDISRDLSNLVPGILTVDVEKDSLKDQYVIKAKMQDECEFSSRVLSDGTLRALTLTTLKNDPKHQGVLMFEEPENGIHAYRLKRLVALLRELTTDFSDTEQIGSPLRQLLINTHSPVLVKHLIEATSALQNGNSSQKVCPPEIVFAQMATRTEKHETSRVTRFIPIDPDPQFKINFAGEPTDFTFAQVVQYLNSADTSQLIERLRDRKAA